MPDDPKRKRGAADIPSQSALQDLLAGIAAQRNVVAHSYAPAISEILKGFEAHSAQWAELAKLIDPAKTARLQLEAMKASGLTEQVQRQADALKAFNWDFSKLPLELREASPKEPTDEPAGALEKEIKTLRAELAAQRDALLTERAGAAGKDNRIEALNKTLEELRNRERLAFLLNQVHPAAQPLLERDENFRNRFLESKACTGFVMSVDIRRSTDLMLKARKPEQFAAFIGSLSSQLTQVVLESFGVFDKFTGDGILAFFPDFYSGSDAGYHALSAAARCHAVFAKHYRRHRTAFISVLQDAGLGIGIDYGELHLVQVSGALTVVGHPVVYACRLGGAPAGVTLLNQQAYEVINDRFGLYFNCEETTQELKHEGKTLAYRALATGKEYEPQTPDWFVATGRPDPVSD